VFFSEPSVDDIGVFLNQREVRPKELELILSRMKRLIRRIYVEMRQSLLGSILPQLDDETREPPLGQNTSGK